MWKHSTQVCCKIFKKERKKKASHSSWLLLESQNTTRISKNPETSKLIRKKNIKI